MCEGGRACSREDPARQGQPNAVPGLHSSWVGDGSVLAMARPWQQHVLKHDLPRRFRELGIGLIINLQEARRARVCVCAALPASCAEQRSCVPCL
jgi:protein tyrosine phosphatase domain-containing protein 1